MSGKHEMGWQPIETAPKDGRDLILACTYFATVGCWEKEDQNWYELNNDPTDVWGGPLEGVIAWMPLPLPPEQKS